MCQSEAQVVVQAKQARQASQARKRAAQKGKHPGASDPSNAPVSATRSSGEHAQGDGQRPLQASDRHQDGAGPDNADLAVVRGHSLEPPLRLAAVAGPSKAACSGVLAGAASESCCHSVSDETLQFTAAAAVDQQTTSDGAATAAALPISPPPCKRETHQVAGPSSCQGLRCYPAHSEQAPHKQAASLGSIATAVQQLKPPDAMPECTIWPESATLCDDILDAHQGQGHSYALAQHQPCAASCCAMQPVPAAAAAGERGGSPLRALSYEAAKQHSSMVACMSEDQYMQLLSTLRCPLTQVNHSMPTSSSLCINVHVVSRDYVSWLMPMCLVAGAAKATCDSRKWRNI